MKIKKQNIAVEKLREFFEACPSGVGSGIELGSVTV
jgi:hypothetical protein